jgi:hypothetical protein
MSERPLKLLSRSAKKADVEHLADQLHGHVLVPVHGPEDVGEGDVDRHQHRGQEVTHAESRVGMTFPEPITSS